MQLEPKIKEWKGDHAYTAGAMIKATAEKYYEELGKQFPNIAYAVGNNWLFRTNITYPFEAISGKKGILSFTPIGKIDISDEQSLYDVVKTIPKNFQDSDIAMLMFSDYKFGEALFELGDMSDESKEDIQIVKGTDFMKEAKFLIFPMLEDKPAFYLRGQEDNLYKAANADNYKFQPKPGTK